MGALSIIADAIEQVSIADLLASTPAERDRFRSLAEAIMRSVQLVDSGVEFRGGDGGSFSLKATGGGGGGGRRDLDRDL